jgi:UDP-N-acetylmuramoyl-tripeptide--D-alanyl-D-alanine ligase
VRKLITDLILSYLRISAKIQLAKIRPEIIGVTGSAGKTSTAYAIKTILASKYKIKLSEKANSETGIPLSLLGLNPNDYSIRDWIRLLTLCPIKLLTNWEKYDKYIAEMGVDSPDQPKNMSYLLRIIRPKIGVFLNALPVHTQFFDHLTKEIDPQKREMYLREVIAKEKGKLILSLPKDGYAILNVDDPFVNRFSTKTIAKPISFGRKAKDFVLVGITNNLKGFTCKFFHEDKVHEIKIKDQILSDDYGYTFLAAVAVGYVENIPIPHCIHDLEEHFHLPPGRMSLIPGIKGTIIIDSSYNASKPTMTSTLNVLKSISRKKKIAVIGDMRELGEEAKLAHEEVAKVAIGAADVIITVGPLMEKYFVPEVIRQGFPKGKIHFFRSSRKVGEWIKRNIVNGGEVILIKGSQNTIFLERVVEELMKNSQVSEELLCRRGSFWEKEREKA